MPDAPSVHRSTALSFADAAIHFSASSNDKPPETVNSHFRSRKAWLSKASLILFSQFPPISLRHCNVNASASLIQFQGHFSTTFFHSADRVGTMQLGSPGGQGLPCRLSRRLFLAHTNRRKAGKEPRLRLRCISSSSADRETVSQRMHRDRSVSRIQSLTLRLHRASSTYTRIPAGLRKATLSLRNRKHLRGLLVCDTGSAPATVKASRVGEFSREIGNVSRGW